MGASQKSILQERSLQGRSVGAFCKSFCRSVLWERPMGASDKIVLQERSVGEFSIGAFSIGEFCRRVLYERSVRAFYKSVLQERSIRAFYKSVLHQLAAYTLLEKVDDGDTASIKSNDSHKKASRKVKQLRVLDGKMAQSLSILLGSVSASRSYLDSFIS